MQVILLFPGQGSQKPGMGKDLAAAFPEARDVFSRVDQAVGAPISGLCFDGPADELMQTNNAQPALYAHGAAVWAVARDELTRRVVAAAGHSLGEHTAYYAAGAVSLENGARLVRRRGEIMYDVGIARPGIMAAILGALTMPIEELCDRAAREAGQVVPANYNSAEQVVVSGEVDAVERVMQLARDAGARRVVRLAVSGAFHSPLMAPAEPLLAEAIARAAFTRPAFPVFSNVTERESTTPTMAREMLLRQLTSPVRWTGLVRNMAAAHPDALYVELGPGNVLSGLVSRIVPGARTVSCSSAVDVDRLMKQLSS